MLVSMKELLEEAEREEKAIGSFTCANMEMVMGTIRAAEELRSSVIIQITESRLPGAPLNYLGPLMVQAAKDATVKVCVHLDHGLTKEKEEEAFACGFTSVMYDGSRYSYEDNIRHTNEAAVLARNQGASVEAELGAVGGREATDRDEQNVYTDPGEAHDFVRRTDIDALAVAIGNAHGHYKGAPRLNFERLVEIRKAAALPLVLHGGSGISDADFRKCIYAGVRKINIATAGLDAVVKSAGDYLLKSAAPDFFRLSAAMVEGAYQNAKHCIQVFNNGEELK